VGDSLIIGATVGQLSFRVEGDEAHEFSWGDIPTDFAYPRPRSSPASQSGLMGCPQPAWLAKCTATRSHACSVFGPADQFLSAPFLPGSSCRLLQKTGSQQRAARVCVWGYGLRG